MTAKQTDFPFIRRLNDAYEKRIRLIPFLNIDSVLIPTPYEKLFPAGEWTFLFDNSPIIRTHPFSFPFFRFDTLLFAGPKSGERSALNDKVNKGNPRIGPVKQCCKRH